MKGLVFLLVLANLLFLAFREGYFGQPDHPDAYRLQQQVSPERIRILARGEPPPRSEDGAGKAGEAVCWRWVGLAVREADALSSLLADQFGDFRQSRRAVSGEGGSWWVYIPPLPGRVEAERRAAELKRQGVADYYVMPENSASRFAISLGVFSSEAAAQERLAAVQEKGVRTAKMAPRQLREPQFVIEVQGGGEHAQALLDAVAQLMPDRRAETAPCQ